MAQTDIQERNDDPAVRSQVLGSGDPEAQEQARQSVIDEVGEDKYYADPMRYWTAQQGSLPETGTVAALGPQRYLKEQLPNPDIAKAGGHTPQRIPEGLVLDPEEAWDHPQGPEPGEQVRLIKSEAVRKRLVTEASETPSDRNYLTLTSDGMSEIQKAQEGEGQDEAGDTAPRASEQPSDGGEGEGRGESQTSAPQTNL